MPSPVTVFRHAIINIACAATALTWGIQSSVADERSDALAFLKTTLECPVPTESSKQSNGSFLVRKTKNEPGGDASNFVLRERHTTTSGVVGAESYETDSFIEVSFSFAEIEGVTVKEGKATVRCSGGQECMNVFYVENPDKELQEVAMRADPMDCFHEGMCRTEVTKEKASYRISTCNSDAAKDVKEAIEFLARQ